MPIKSRFEGPNGIRPVCLIILDGVGVARAGETNALTVANTPNLDGYESNRPHTTLRAAGADVGLPDGQMGNSEVGHLNLGAGRVVYQDLTRINRAIEDGSFFQNQVLADAVDKAKATGSTLHLMGLVSDGGVHSQNSHLFALLKLAKERGLDKVIVHCFLDGRDTPPQSALTFISQLEEKMREIGVGKVGTVSGRYYAMDRDKRWQRTKLAYDALVFGQGQKAPSASEAVERSYEKGENDEFVLPTIIGAYDRIQDGDSVIFYNFRSDRARQLTMALTEPEFDSFDRGLGPPRTFFVSLTLYDAKFNLSVAFDQEKITNTLAEVLAAEGLRQIHLAETEKYAHVTFFLNGGVEEEVAGEDRVLIPSPKVATYDLMPQMSAQEVAAKAVTAIETRTYDFIVINFANCDMVGHTGILSAAVDAAAAVDSVIGRIVEAIGNQGGATIITSDHGNAEQMIEADGQPRTAHTSNRVPMILITNRSLGLKEGNRLADVAPTILSLMDIPLPPEMTGENLLISR